MDASTVPTGATRIRRTATASTRQRDDPAGGHRERADRVRETGYDVRLVRQFDADVAFDLSEDAYGDIRGAAGDQVGRRTGRGEIPDAVGVGGHRVGRDDPQFALQGDADNWRFAGVGKADEQVVTLATPREGSAGAVLDHMAWAGRQTWQAYFAIRRPTGDPEQEAAVPQDGLSPGLRPELPGDALNQCHAPPPPSNSPQSAPRCQRAIHVPGNRIPTDCLT